MCNSQALVRIQKSYCVNRAMKSVPEKLQSRATSCPLCADKVAPSFFELGGMPVSIGCQWPSTQEARDCAKGDISLSFCPGCGFVWNSAFDPSAMAYNESYDNSLDHSPVFRRYANNLAARLVKTYGLRGKEVIEIGCGKGNFLNLLCEAGCSRGYGFDPSYEPERITGQASERLSIVGDYYSQKYRDIKGDLVCARHVFEHIADPISFLEMVRRSIGDRLSTVVYFEVPNLRFILDGLSIWDVIYEHCNYFSVESLGNVFEKCGFEVLRLEASYGDQFIGIEARPSGSNREKSHGRGNVEDLRRSVFAFSSHAKNRMQDWRAMLFELRKGSRKAVIWGAGAKAVGFLNMLKIRDEVPYAVDINPHKHGRHLAGTGQEIVPPEFLRQHNPDVVILMNAIYREEIAAHLAQLNVDAEIMAA